MPIASSQMIFLIVKSTLFNYRFYIAISYAVSFEILKRGKLIFI
jgi:hypothetical protein